MWGDLAWRLRTRHGLERRRDLNATRRCVPNACDLDSLFVPTLILVHHLMPELPEFKAAEAGCHFAIAKIEKDTGVRIWGSSLQHIYHDPTGRERARNAYPDDRKDLVVELTEELASVTIRGSGTANQTPLWPRCPGSCPSLDVLARPLAKQPPYKFMAKEGFSSLKLHNVTSTPRTLVVDFGVVLAQVRLKCV